MDEEGVVAWLVVEVNFAFDLSWVADGQHADARNDAQWVPADADKLQPHWHTGRHEWVEELVADLGESVHYSYWLA